MPVFNKAALTRHCLATLRPTIEGAGDGEIIVIDNASSDETPEMLRAFPWVRVVRNEENVGFARANNQGARLAAGRYLVLMNNDMEAHPGWLAAMLETAAATDVGVVGAKLLFPDGTLQHAGVGIAALRFGSAPFFAMHEFYRASGDTPEANIVRDLQCVTAACMVTPRALFEELGGFDKGFWNGNEDVDYCLRVREKGLRIVYEPRASLTHFESQSGVQRFRRLAYNIERFSDRWRHAAVEHDAQLHALASGLIRREVRTPNGCYSFETRPIPRTSVLIHGDPERAKQLESSHVFRANAVPIHHVIRVAEAEAIATARAEMELRGERYVVFLDARVRLNDGWLDELIKQVEFSNNVGAATYCDAAAPSQDVNPVAADARCTLLSLRRFPQHCRLQDVPTLDEAVADFMLRAYELRVVTRGASRVIAQLPPRAVPLAAIDKTAALALEERLRPKPRAQAPLVSIVTLSWNAPEYTKMALESIRAHTREPYEIIVVDNGSREETTTWLRTLTDVRAIFNDRNRGFAGGTNQGIAAARGEYVVMLNNDVVVTDGWLDGLVGAFDRVPGLGVSAVRSNRIAGDQMILNATYTDMASMHFYASERRTAFRHQGYTTDRAIGLCLCIHRSVIDEIGGIDERFGVGNFEDDDFCLRVRAAGYRIYVCNDVFIHHFGSRSFAANNVEYGKTLRDNWKQFAAKWGLGALSDGGYDSRPAIARGFDRAEHYVPLPAPPAAMQKDESTVTPRPYRAVFAAVVTGEESWGDVGPFVRRYAQAFGADAGVLLAIATQGQLDAERVGARVERALQRLGLDPKASPDIDVSEERDVEEWIRGFGEVRRARVNDDERLRQCEALAAHSPSALRRWLDGVPA